MAEKPIDRWLGIASIVVGIALFLLPKSPPLVIGALLVIFLLLLHPVLNFWWIEETRGRKWFAICLLAVACVLIGRASWPVPQMKPPTAVEIAGEVWKHAPKDTPSASKKIPDGPSSPTPNPIAIRGDKKTELNRRTLAVRPATSTTSGPLNTARNPDVPRFLDAPSIDPTGNTHVAYTNAGNADAIKTVAIRSSEIGQWVVSPSGDFRAFMQRRDPALPTLPQQYYPDIPRIIHTGKGFEVMWKNDADILIQKQHADPNSVVRTRIDITYEINDEGAAPLPSITEHFCYVVRDNRVLRVTCN